MEPIIRQMLHIRGREVRFLGEHLREVERAWFALFRRDLHLEEPTIRREIEQLLDRERCSKEFSTYLRLDLDSEAKWHLALEGDSLYRGYVLRALRPEAVTIRFDLPFEGLPTVAAAQTWQTARCMAESRKVRSVVRMSEDLTLLEADGVPLFAVAGRTVYTSRELRGVEGRLAREAIRRAGYRFEVIPLKRDHLPDIEELFYVDHRGVSALQSCDGKWMLAAVAARVAEELEAVVRKI
jgi:hypothetical protein